METEFINEVNVFWKEFIHILPKAIIAFVIFILFLFLSGKVSNLVKNRLVFRTKDPLLSGFISKITKWIVSIIGFVICMEILGFATLAGGIVTGAGLSAVILGFAFKNIGENFLSGLLLAFKRPFKVGDKNNTEGLLTSLRGVICTKQARIYKRNIFRGEQYIIKIHTTHSNEHCFVLSIYKNYIHLEIPYSNLNKKISIIFILLAPRKIDTMDKIINMTIKCLFFIFFSYI